MRATIVVSKQVTSPEMFGVWVRALLTAVAYAVTWLAFWLSGNASQAGTIAILIGLVVALVQNANRFHEPSAEIVNAYRLLAVPLVLCWLILRSDAGWMSLPLVVEAIGMALAPFASRIVDGKRVPYFGPFEISRQEHETQAGKVQHER